MKKTIKILSIILFVLGILFFSDAIRKYQVLTKSRAEGTQQLPLRVLDFNTETGSDQYGPSKCGDQRNEMIAFSRQKIQGLADLIVNNNIDLAFFQEMQIRCGFNETEELAKILQARNYAMNYTYKEFIEGQTQWFHVATFSKNAFVANSAEHFPIGAINTGTRWFTKVKVVLPNNSVITTYNIHTRNLTACDHVQYFLRHVASDTSPFLMLAGDFNHHMKQDSCGESIARYTLNTTVADLTSDLEIIRHPIDYIAIATNPNWSFVSSQYQGHGIEYHPSVIANLLVSGASIVPTATSVPTVSTPPPEITPSPTYGLAACTYQDGQLQVSNPPCGICSISDVSPSIDTININFSCEVYCDTTGTAKDLSTCGNGVQAQYEVEKILWFWCRGSGNSPCTSTSADFKKSGEFSGGRPWLLTQQGRRNFALFCTEDSQMCGRVQADLHFTKVTSFVKDLVTDCPIETITVTATPIVTVTVSPTVAVTVTPTVTVSSTPGMTYTPSPPSHTPLPTTTQTPSSTDTPVPTIPPPTATLTIVPLATPIPNETPNPRPTEIAQPQSTWTPVPTWTPAPTYTPRPTNTPLPTATSVPTVAPSLSTPTPVKALTVDDQPPGIPPWILILSPFVIIILGLLL